MRLSVTHPDGWKRSSLVDFLASKFDTFCPIAIRSKILNNYNLMTLTKSDLEQIGSVIEEKIKPLESEIKDIKKSVKKIEVNVESMLGFLDEQDVKLHKRVTRIEKHLNLPQN